MVSLHPNYKKMQGDSLPLMSTSEIKDGERNTTTLGSSTMSSAIVEEEPMVYAYLKGTNDSHFVLDKRKMTIGKDPNCDVVLHNSKTISGQHARIDFRKGSGDTYQCILTDLQSQNGTLVNDKRLYLDMTTKQLKNGDQIRFGFDQITYTIDFLFETEQKAQVVSDERGFVGIVNPDFKPGKSKMRKSKSADKLNTMKDKKEEKVSKEFKDKMNKQQQEFKSLLEQRRQEKKKNKDQSSITFQTAKGSKTVSLSELEESSEDEDFIPEEEEIKKDTANPVESKQSSPKRSPKVEAPDLTATSRSENNVTAEKQLRQSNTFEEQELYHFNLLVNTVHLLSYKLLGELGESKTEEDDQQILETMSKTNGKNMAEMLTTKLQEVKKLLNTCLKSANKKMEEKEKQNAEKEKQNTENENYRNKGIERYATELQTELDSLRFELEMKKQTILELSSKSQDKSKDQEVIRTLRESLVLKDRELKDLQTQVVTNSLVGYSSDVAKTRMQNLMTNLMKELEDCKKKNYEYENRLTKRLFEWQQVKEENLRFSQKVSELQETIHRQMTDLHSVLLHKDQKVNSWKSRIAEIASDNNEMRYRAASFLLSAIQENERKDNEYILKYEEAKRGLNFAQMENNDLRIEVNNLKDVLQYTDTYATKKTIDTLKDKIHQMETDCSMERVLEMQNTILVLSAKISDMGRNHKFYLQEIARSKQQSRGQFKEASCIGTLERQLQWYENKVETLTKQLEKSQKELAQQVEGSFSEMVLQPVFTSNIPITSEEKPKPTIEAPSEQVSAILTNEEKPEKKDETESKPADMSLLDTSMNSSSLEIK